MISKYSGFSFIIYCNIIELLSLSKYNTFFNKINLFKTLKFLFPFPKILKRKILSPI